MESKNKILLAIFSTLIVVILVLGISIHIRKNTEAKIAAANKTIEENAAATAKTQQGLKEVKEYDNSVATVCLLEYANLTNLLSDQRLEFTQSQYDEYNRIQSVFLNFESAEKVNNSSAVTCIQESDNLYSLLEDQNFQFTSEQRQEYERIRDALISLRILVR